MVAQQNVAHFMPQHGRDFIFALNVIQHAQRHEHVTERISRWAEAVAVDDLHLQCWHLPGPALGQSGHDALQIDLQRRDVHQVVLA
ncbi:hypothetical protein D3C86_1566670 [compost metagenome]